MVEGPGCKLKGEKLRKRAKGQTVKSVSGNVIEKRTKGEKEIISPFEQLIGKQLIDVKTLGKELFVIFEDDVCLRVHFLMTGSVRYNNEPCEFGNGKAAEPRLKLHMSKDEIGFYDSAVEMRSAAECIEKHSVFIDLDICSPTFDIKRAAQTLMEHPDRLVCDVILDQLVLPGVGNIIKNEALFDAGINPNSKIKELSPDLVFHLVKMNRDFTNIFYKCRKEGKNLNKFMRVYKKADCTECSTKLIKCRLGEYERLTFFCRQCQTNTIKSSKRLPKKNSLLGWVVATKHQVPWNCSVCTMENKPANTKCTVCLTPKSPQLDANVSSNLRQKIPITSQSPTNSPFTALQHSSPIAMSTLLSMEYGLIPSLYSSLTHSDKKRSLDSTPEDSCRIGKYKFKKITHDTPESSSLPSKHQSIASLSSPVSSVKMENVNPRRIASPKPILVNMRDDTFKKTEDQILCSGHTKPAKKSVVEKKNENRGRIFYVCNMPIAKQCKFFMWGDGHHPFCNHGKISIVRTVMKQNANNGREFYCCSLPKPKQCDFFEWVDKKT